MTAKKKNICVIQDCNCGLFYSSCDFLAITLVNDLTSEMRGDRSEGVSHNRAASTSQVCIL